MSTAAWVTLYAVGAVAFLLAFIWLEDDKHEGEYCLPPRAVAGFGAALASVWPASFFYLAGRHLRLPERTASFRSKFNFGERLVLKIREIKDAKS